MHRRNRWREKNEMNRRFSLSFGYWWGLTSSQQLRLSRTHKKTHWKMRIVREQRWNIERLPVDYWKNTAETGIVVADEKNVSSQATENKMWTAQNSNSHWKRTRTPKKGWDNSSIWQFSQVKHLLNTHMRLSRGRAWMVGFPIQFAYKCSVLRIFMCAAM